MSKARGGFIKAGLGEASNFKGLSYKVPSGDINGQNFSGDRVPSKLLAKVRKGQKAAVTVIVKRMDTGQKIPIEGLITEN